MSKNKLGTAFIKQLSSDALNSAAINHPYLHAISRGDLPNIDLALKDFAFQYSIYSSKFTQYVSSVIDNLSNPQHKQILLNNLAEEQGDTHGIELPDDVLASVADQPHASLYRRFQEAIGVDTEYSKQTPQSQTAVLWSKQLLQLCQENACVGIGAVGIGTELIVSHIYDQILTGLKAHSQLTMEERVFFDLHSVCDDEHASQMILIAEDLACDPEACEQIEFGTHMAINMRIMFWDRMLDRAQNFPAAATPTIEKLSTAGY